MSVVIYKDGVEYHLNDGQTFESYLINRNDYELSAEAILDMKWSDIRIIRNAKLAASDWTQISDNSLKEEEKIAWSEYRNKLRDITDLFFDPDNVVWPTEPK